MDKAYLLPQYPYAADYGQVLLSALGGVDYADDRQYRENKAHKAQQYGAYEYQPPGYECQYGISNEVLPGEKAVVSVKCGKLLLIKVR